MVGGLWAVRLEFGGGIKRSVGLPVMDVGSPAYSTSLLSQWKYHGHDVLNFRPGIGDILKRNGKELY